MPQSLELHYGDTKVLAGTLETIQEVADLLAANDAPEAHRLLQACVDFHNILTPHCRTHEIPMPRRPVLGAVSRE